MIETTDIQIQLQEKWNVVFISLIAFSFISGVIWYQKLFKFPKANPYPLIKGTDVLKGFGFFFLFQILAIAIKSVINLILIASGKGYLTLPGPSTQGWDSLIILFGGFVGVFCSYKFLSSMQRQQIINQTDQPWIYHLKIGMLTCAMVYPIVIALGQLISIGVWHLFQQPFVEQGVVQYLRQALKQPLLGSLIGMTIVCLVPLAEEFLFRGLLQNWLKNKMQLWKAIGLTSLIFACFHYSFGQKLGNIEILSSLFFLSYVLGFIYERQRSLWASIGLHGFFNFINFMLIFIEAK